MCSMNGAFIVRSLEIWDSRKLGKAKEDNLKCAYKKEFGTCIDMAWEK